MNPLDDLSQHLATLHDPQRITAVRQILAHHQPDSAIFHQVVRLASHVLRTPVALISLVEDNRQVFVAQTGLAEPWRSLGETDLEHSFCQYVVSRRAPLNVRYAPEDALVAGNLAIKDIGVIAYLGVPLIVGPGHVLGSLCVIDAEAREWSAADLASLNDLAALVQREFELQLITADESAQHQFQAGLRRALEELARGRDLSQVLTLICSAVEKRLGDAHCSVMLVRDDRSSLEPVAGPSLPIGYLEAITGLPIGPEMAVCGSAAFRKTRVVVPDTLQEPFLAPWRKIIESFQLYSCWSQPFFDSNGAVLGTYALYRHYSYQPSEAEFNLIEQVVSVAAIAVERRQREAQLQQMTAELRQSFAGLSAVIEHAQDAIWAVDHRGRLSHSNGGFRQLAAHCGLEVRPEMVITEYPALLPLLPSSAYQRAFLGESVQYEVNLLSFQGAALWYDVRLNPIHSDRQIFSVVAFARDISQQKRAEAHWQAQQASLQVIQRREMLGTLTSGIAHNFNNQLMTILANLDLLSHEIAPQSEAAEYAHAIRRGATRLADLTSQLMTYSGGEQPKPAPLDLHQLIGELSRLILPSFDHQINLTIQVLHQPERLIGDRTQIAQAITALLINAVEALGAPPHGEITLTLDQQVIGDQTPLSADQPALAAGSYALVEIADSGEGMAPEVLAQAMLPFFTTRMTGRGLGLAVAHAIALAHQGQIMLKSHPGEGTRAQLWLPQNPALAGQRRAPMPGVLSPELPVVLIVDDEEIVLQTTVRLLQRSKLAVVGCPDLPSAIALIEQHGATLRCIVLDWTLPGVQGEAAVIAIREALPDVAIIVISGYSDSEILGRLSIPIDGFFSKPFRSQDLIARVRAILEH